MSQRLIGRSADLKRLQDEGFNLEVRAGYLLVRDIPYVTPSREIKKGTIVTPLTLAGETTTTPSDHVVDFAGDMPCDNSGNPLRQIVIQSSPQQVADGLIVNHKFSSKPIPPASYRDYYEKITAYVAILEGYARAIDASVSARTFPVIVNDSDDSPFVYVDTASSRAGIGVPVRKLQLGRVAIVGLGGTGAYILDLIAKSPIREIHLFDGDVFLTHNAFRAPGAAPIAALEAKLPKVSYYASSYAQMHRGIVPHPYHVDAHNVADLAGMDFAFVAIDAGVAKRVIVQALEGFGTPFIDVGLGIIQVDDALSGILRVTTSLSIKRDHFRSRVSLGGGPDGGAYDRNIQIADLNALNAALAVIRWKRYCGFYLDFERECQSTYSIDTNTIANDERL